MWPNRPQRPLQPCLIITIPSVPLSYPTLVVCSHWILSWLRAQSAHKTFILNTHSLSRSFVLLTIVSYYRQGELLLI